MSFSFARLTNLAISSEFKPCFSLNLAIQASNSGNFFALRQAASAREIINMEVIFQNTHQFEKDLKKVGSIEKEKVVKQINRMAEYFSSDKDTFFKFAYRAHITLRNGLESSMFIMRAGMKLRILFTIDDDPIFDQRIFTFLRLVKHDDYDKVFSQLAESLYQKYLVEYTADGD